MRARLLVGVVLFAASLGSALVATGDGGLGPARQWAVVNITEPTLIGNTIVQGPVIFVHDTERMARGEPCTSVRLFSPGSGPLEEMASFHCIPRLGKVVNRFTMTTRPNWTLGFGCVLTSYQFAGDSEIHGVPTPADAH